MKFFLLTVSSAELDPAMAHSTLGDFLGDRYEPIAESLISKLEPAMDNVRNRKDSSLSLSSDETILLYIWAKLGAGAVNAEEISESLSKLLSDKDKPEENPSR